MELRVNGDWRPFADGATVAQVLAELGTEPRGVAVAVDGQVVRRGAWADTVLAPGAQVEVLTAVQGG
ncbi:sulfur carrier protein ThiS [Amycolatopsis minnesotensis]|uniref:Sulfur carrier protein ThiS n=1 Tax=Amycolatopsis minnesotensis TaxID=337894 RepID=A0ABN2Q157_9PSEU